MAREQIGRAPEAPGVYLLKNKGGHVLYVGKAKQLRNRLKSYLNPQRDERPSVALLVPQVHSVEWLLTETEKEALLLENSLIKTHRPRYNILFRDDKSYASLRMTKHRFPRLFITRKIIKDGSHYFGPYASVYDLRQTLKLLQRVFQIRDCTDVFMANRSRACLQHQIKRCSAPCVSLVEESEYQSQARQVTEFLIGRRDELLSTLREEMNGAAGSQRYEEAARLRDRIWALEGTLEPQQVEARDDERDADAVGLGGDQDATLVKVLKIRRGRMVGADELFLEEPISASTEIVRAFLHQYYLADHPGREIPPEIFLPGEIPDHGTFSELLRERRGRKTVLRQPKRGRGFRLLRLAETNARSSLAERKRRSTQNQKLLEQLQYKLRLDHFPRRIEGYDISNFHGAEPVGSRVVFMDGEADKTKYRHYRIRSIKGANDFGMLHEVFERRFRKMNEENRPDLILVDGGKGQLRQVLDVLKDFQVEGVETASLAKERELKSRSGKKFAPERVYLPGQKNPLVFPPSSPLLHLLQRVRDEAHRFGITRHRSARKRVTLRSVLRQVPQVGPKRQKCLLRAFRSFDDLRSASRDSLRVVPGMTESSARSVYDFFRRPNDADE